MTARKTMLEGFYYEKDPTGLYNLYYVEFTGEHKDRFFCGPEVAIGYTRAKDDPERLISHKHGSPEDVYRWAQKQRLEAMFKPEDESIFSPFVVVSGEWEVEDLNAIINQPGALAPVLEKMGLEVETH